MSPKQKLHRTLAYFTLVFLLIFCKQISLFGSLACCVYLIISYVATKWNSPQVLFVYKLSSTSCCCQCSCLYYINPLVSPCCLLSSIQLISHMCVWWPLAHICSTYCKECRWSTWSFSPFVFCTQLGSAVKTEFRYIPLPGSFPT